MLGFIERRHARFGLSFLLALVLSPLLGPVDAQAQAVTRQMVTGSVVDEAGRPLAGVVLTVRDADGAVLRLTTDALGRFRLPPIEPGLYHIVAERTGFASVDTDLEVGAGETVVAELRMGGPPDLPVVTVDPPPDTAPPVYNAEFTPLAGRDPLTVVADEPTRLVFDIGAPREESVLGGDLSISAVIEAAERPTPLTVSLDCFVCADEANQLADITYDPETRSSDQAVFEFTARRALVAENGGLGRLVLTVFLEGVELDVIEIPLIVGFATDEALEAYRPPARYTVGAFPAELLEPPDLVVFVGPSAGSDRLPVRLLPLDPVLRERLGAVASSMPFRSGVNQADLEDLARQTYLGLSEVVLNRNALLDSLYAITTDGAVTPSSTGRFSVADSQAVVRRFDRLGRELYLRLFEDGDLGLLRAMAEVEGYARARYQRGDPLRMRVHNTGPWVPWQLLASTLEGAEADPERLWGMRYAIGVKQDAPGRGGRVATLLPWPGDDDLVLATHQHDAVIQHGADLLGTTLSGRTGMRVLRHDERDPFLRDVERLARELKFLLFFTHGSSGTGAGESDLLGAGPRLHFSDDEVITPADVNRLRDVLTSAERLAKVPALQAQPLVFLNTCESGTGGLVPTTNNNFVGTFLRNGASSVIATESAVWVGFAHDFAADVIDAVFSGHAVATAVQRARVKHLAERGNPLGLIYSLYGNPSARFAVPLEPE